ncbi:unnamed protein product [Dovyalis caffra]|uniref:Uncharacterized protein n=1 Tax=Dovyalis caffra TaxID=77055 RepID=A0AAV1R3Q0_9ROSI|nr:unnamed protein product [Dovyalis caffra]
MWANTVQLRATSDDSAEAMEIKTAGDPGDRDARSRGDDKEEIKLRVPRLVGQKSKAERRNFGGMLSTTFSRESEQGISSGAKMVKKCLRELHVLTNNQPANWQIKAKSRSIKRLNSTHKAAGSNAAYFRLASGYLKPSSGRLVAHFQIHNKIKTTQAQELRLDNWGSENTLSPNCYKRANEGIKLR